MRQELNEGVLTLTLDRPERLNAVDAAEMNALAEVVEQVGSQPDVRVVVLRGEGRALCSGLDLPSFDVPDAASTIDAANRLVAAMTAIPKPVVVLARGAVAGVGVPIALAGDLVIADANSYLLLAFTRIGLMPDGGSTALVAASVGRAKAMRMALLAEKLTASDALDAGLITHVVDPANYDNEVEAVLDQLAHGPVVAYSRTKAAINAATLGGLASAFALEKEGQIGLLNANDFAEGAKAFTEKRSPQFADN